MLAVASMNTPEIVALLPVPPLTANGELGGEAYTPRLEIKTPVIAPNPSTLTTLSCAGFVVVPPTTSIVSFTV